MNMIAHHLKNHAARVMPASAMKYGSHHEQLGMNGSHHDVLPMKSHDEVLLAHSDGFRPVEMRLAS